MKTNIWQEYYESVDNLRLRGDYTTVRGYNMGAWFGHDTNLMGKTVNIAVTWKNTMLTQADFTIRVLDLYETTEENYAVGPQREVLSFEFDEDYYESKIPRDSEPDWSVVVRTLPSVDIRPIDVVINWTVE